MDRAIVLEMRRKLPHEKVEHLRHAEKTVFHTLSAKLARFAQDYADRLSTITLALPDSLHDRAKDNWEPLLAIANIAGKEWLALAQAAAMRLSTHTDAPSTSIELLADIQVIFDSKQVERITSNELINALCADEEKPWATYNRGLPIKPRQVASRLKEFGITSMTIRLDSMTTLKGYTKPQFLDAFARYLAPSPKNP
jgi:putative DNA primase/helicase